MKRSFRPFIVANWKLYVRTREDAYEKAKVIARSAKKIKAQLIVCPPAPFIEAVSKTLTPAKVMIGSQTVSANGIDTRTGEITAVMIGSLGAQFVIVGHSERREMGEEGDQIRDRIYSVFDTKMSVILCVGEQTRDASSGDHFTIIENQLRSALVKILPRDAKRIVIAYEPVWAIGKKAEDAMTPPQLEEMVIYIRKILVDLLGRTAALTIPILYGGSVEPTNAKELMESGVSGFLVGHASVEPSSYLAIARASTESHGSKKR
jgi:triosephosphate isomerase